MSEAVLVTLALTVVLLVFLLIAGRKLGFLSPSSLFLYSQYIMAVGIVPSLAEGNVADRTHRDLLLLTFLSYVLGTLLIVAMLEPRLGRANYSPIVSFDYPAKPVSFWIVISIAIGVAYYAAIGYVAFFASLSAVVEGGSEDVAGLRLESYAGSRYLFPGYVNQFKNALLPALFLVVVVASFKLEKRSRLLTAVGLGSVTMVLLIGTGQRHPLIKALVLAVVFAYALFPRIAVRSVIGAAGLGVPLFIVTTFASGRITSDLESAESFSDQVSVFADHLIYRFFSSSQLSATVGFRYVYNSADIAVASEWAKGLAGLLPGQPGTDIANRIFEIMYGSTRGTSPLSLWGSAFYNLGFWGSVVFAGVLGVLFALVSASFLKRRTLNLIQAAGIAGITMTLGLWTTEGPTTVLNSGLAVFVVLLFWGDRIENRGGFPAQRESQSTKGPTVPSGVGGAREVLKGSRP